ncbi:hypothetical protein ABIF53_005627 [Bradyrhizobium japonicum]
MKARSALLLGSLSAALVAVALTSPRVIAADKVDPVADAKAFQNFFFQKFPTVKHEDFVNGPYSMNEDMKRQWREKEEFPPYEFALDAGKEMFATPFKNGKTLCRLLPEWRHRHPPELPLLRREGGQGRHAGARAQPLPRGQW